MSASSFVRASGVLKSGDTVYNPVRGKKDRIGRLLQMHANERKEIKEVRAGDIAACVGLKDVTTGETLCDVQKVILLERMEFPEPAVISQAVEPKTKVDQEKMGVALGRLAQEDPSFRVHRRGIGPDHHLRHGRAAPGDHRRPHEARVRRRGLGRQAAGGLPRDLRNRSSPRASSSSSPAGAASTATSGSSSSRSPKGKFVDAIKGGRVPKEFIPAVKKGVDEALAGRRARGLHGRRQGHAHRRLVPRGGFERERVQDGGDLRLQGRHARGHADAVEPIMAVEVETPEKMGDVIGDLSGRRGVIQGMDDLPGGKAIKAEVPLARCSATRRGCVR